MIIDCKGVWISLPKISAITPGAAAGLNVRLMGDPNPIYLNAEQAKTLLAALEPRPERYSKKPAYFL